MTFSRPVMALYGTIWLVCGVIVGLNPAPGDSARAQSIPMVGWLLAVGGVYVIYKACTGAEGKTATPNKPSRHSNGRDATSNGQVVKLGLATLVCGLIGIYMLGSGIAEGKATNICLGVVFLSAVIPTAGHVIALTADRVDRS